MQDILGSVCLVLTLENEIMLIIQSHFMNAISMQIEVHTSHAWLHLAVQLSALMFFLEKSFLTWYLLVGISLW